MLSCLSCLLVGATAAVCPATNEPSPAVVTVIASKESPAQDAWIVNPDCSVEIISFASPGDASVGIDSPGGHILVMRSKGIERVESLPSQVVQISLEGNPLSKGVDFTRVIALESITLSLAALDSIQFPDSVIRITIVDGGFTALTIKLPPNLVELTITNTALKSLKGVVFPASLRTIDLSGNQLDSLEGVVFPTTMNTLDLTGNQLTTLSGVIFPTKIVRLFLTTNKLTTPDCVFPSTAEVLDLSSNQLTTLGGATFPTSCVLINLNNNKLTSLKTELPVDLTTLQADSNQLISLNGTVLPEGLKYLELRHNALKAIDTPLPRYLDSLYLTNNQISSLRGVWLPALLTILNLDHNKLKTISTNLPRRMKTLYLDGNRISSLKGVSLPTALEYLSLTGNKLTALETFLPATLQLLDLQYNPFRTFELVTIPQKRLMVELTNTNLATVRGVRWPTGYNDVQLYGCTEDCGIMSFEIRRSDLDSFMAYGTLNQIAFEQSECSNPQAELVPIGRINNVCVISDELFEELYPPIEEIILDEIFEPPPEGDDSMYPPEEPDPPEETELPQTAQPPVQPTPTPSPELELPPHNHTHSTSGSGSSSGSGGDDIDVSYLVTVPKATKSSKSPRATTQPEPSGNDDSNASTGDDSSTGTGTRGAKKNPTASKGPLVLAANSTTEGSDADSPLGSVAPTKSTLKANVLPVVVASVSAALLVLIGVCVYHLVGAGRRKKSTTGGNGQYLSLESPGTGLTTEPSTASFLVNDIRNDELLVVFRLDESHVALGGEIKRSGVGVVYRGVFQGREVAVKRVMATAAAGDDVLTHFMDEIRVCASLDHPKIVAFVGFTWKDHSSLSAVAEFMAGGDLSTLLTKQGRAVSADDWKTPWAADTVQIKSKLSIALDVAEAVVYLHSMKTPVIHRDLKARNVLVDTHGNAKLSGFSISREISFDETMTRKAGSPAWMAPELLRGERYDEKADIYSLGVLLVELDSGCHPYANATVESESTGSVVMGNMEMARLVSEGKLRPSVSAGCPEQVASLVATCLSFEAETRPTAMKVSHAIRQIHKSFAQVP